MKTTIKLVLSKLFCLIPLKRRIVFSNFHGKLPGDNPYYIWQWAENNGIRSIWLVNDVKLAKKKYKTYKFTKFVSFRGIDAIFSLATSSVWVDNVRKPWVTRKRKGQIYIQTWHGEPLKKIEQDVKSLDKNYVNWAIKDSSVIDYVISGSNLSEDVFRHSFWLSNPDNKILKVGEPRWDVFKRIDNVDSESIDQYLGIEKHHKIILYMPTFRDLQDDNDIIELNYNKLMQLFDSDYRLVVKLHPNIADKFVYEKNDRVINASGYGNPQDLIARSELVITDYSSSMFDAMIANKKVILLAKDLDQYLSHNRELYLDYNELPFPKFYSEEDMLTFIKNHYQDEFRFNYDSFKTKYGFIETYQATNKISKILMNRLGSERK